MPAGALAAPARPPLNHARARGLQAFARFLTAAAAAVHAVGGEMGMNIADWTILGPGYWHLYRNTGVDIFASMTPTYGEDASDWAYVNALVATLPTAAADVGVSNTLQVSGPPGGQCASAPFDLPPFTNWSRCNRTASIYDACPWNATDLAALLDYASSRGITHASVWRNDIDEACFDGTAPWMYDTLANWIAGVGVGGVGGVSRPSPIEPRSSRDTPPAAQRHAADPDPPPAGGECSFSCTAGQPSCPLTVPGSKCDYLFGVMGGNLIDLIANGTAAEPAGHGGTSAGSRSLPAAALSLLMAGCPQPYGCCAPSKAACVQPPPPPACADATALLRRFRANPGTSFGGQAFPLLWHTFGPSCWGAGGKTTDRAWLFGLINASLPMTREAATPQEVSYSNMYLMSTVNAILFGEIVQGERGRVSADIGYSMWDEWRNYTAATGGLHEFTSPTYTYVQLTALVRIRSSLEGAAGRNRNQAGNGSFLGSVCSAARTEGLQRGVRAAK